MCISSTEKSRFDSVVVLSLEEYKVIVKEYSKVGHLYPEKNTHQYRWFKGSIDIGVMRDISA